MNILVLGGDGYLGWATAMHLSNRGHNVVVVDNYYKRRACLDLNISPLIPVPNLPERAAIWHNKTEKDIGVEIGDVANYEFLQRVIREFQPNAIVHYAEQPSAPYSMKDFSTAASTLTNNLVSTLSVAMAVRDHCPRCHIVKLGTMGEYGTPNIDIEEGYLDVTHNGRKQTFLYPKMPGSIYHLSKVSDSDFLYFAVRTWSLAVTDLNQGPVYGIETNELSFDAQLAPTFFYDSIFGTVLNRYIVQAVAGVPLTVYGQGGQTRGFINIRDTLQCIELALTKPAAAGQFRVFNQFTETFSVEDLAEKVVAVANRNGVKATLKKIENPRKELEKHYYNPKHTGLLELGLKPHLLTDDVLEGMLAYVAKHKHRINTNYVMPNVKWA